MATSGAMTVGVAEVVEVTGVVGVEEAEEGGWTAKVEAVPADL